MKQKHNAGFSLVEVLVSIALLGILFIPTCSSLILSMRMNANTDAMMQAQFAVSSAVETLMAEGITRASDTYDIDGATDRFPGVSVVTSQEDGDPYYTVTVTSDDLESVFVTTRIRSVEPAQEGGSGT